MEREEDCQTEEQEDWLEEQVKQVRKPEKKRRIPDYQAAMMPCDACQ